MIRLFVENELKMGASVDLTPDQAHYVGRVMRLGAGDGILLFDGRNGEWRARIDQIEKRRARLSVYELTRPQSDDQTITQGPWLAFAPIKKTGTDFIVQKATELGVARLMPVHTANSQTDRINLERWGANVIEAAEQCERLSVPTLDPPQTLAAMVDAWPQTRPLIVLDETGGGAPAAAAFKDLIGTPVGFLVGPEGGFQRAELDRLAKLPFVSAVSLGARILRAETACIATLAAWQAIAGDWR